MGYEKQFKKDFQEIMNYVNDNQAKVEQGNLSIKAVDSHNRVLQLTDNESVGYYRYESEYGTFKIRNIANISLSNQFYTAISDFDNLGRLVHFRYDDGNHIYYVYRTPTTFTTGAKIICSKNRVVQIIINEKLEDSYVAEIMELVPECISRHELKCSSMQPIIKASIIRE